MLTEAYIEALLVDEELADLVWEAWDRGQINSEMVKVIRTAIVEVQGAKQLVPQVAHLRLQEGLGVGWAAWQYRWNS